MDDTTERAEDYLNEDYSWRSWLLTTDHKRIGILYLISVTFFFLVGGAAAVLVRLKLLTPGPALMEAQTYNNLFTIHGVMMVFFFLIPAIPSVLGNFLVPLMLGARDLAFPKLNLLSWYVYLAGGFFTLAAVVAGGAREGRQPVRLDPGVRGSVQCLWRTDGRGRLHERRRGTASALSAGSRACAARAGGARHFF